MRGHGLSRPAPLSFKEALADLLAILDILQVEQAIFVGHSMGGNLHQELVFHHPERVKALGVSGLHLEFSKTLHPGIDQPQCGRTDLQAVSIQNVDQPIAGSHRDIEGVRRNPCDRPWKALNKDEFVQIMMETPSCLHQEPGYQINKPILMMVGDNDATGNIRKVMPIWAKKEPDCKFVIIPNAKHAANLDNPEFFHRTLQEFLSKFKVN